MSSRHALTAITFLAVVALLAPAGTVAAGGGLLPYDTSRLGIADPESDSHLYAIPDGDETTLIRVRPPDRGGRTLDVLHLRGDLMVPNVAADGTTAGLSADGETLVLAEPRVRFPISETHLTLIDAERLESAGTVDLRGDFSVDSISPDGEMLYLVHYVDRRDPSVYEVRAYDIAAERLLEEPILDRRIAPRVMAGVPLTRAYSPDGAWAYTLYDGGAGHHAEPFVHALDTENAVALCIDLPTLAQAPQRNLYGLRLEPSADGEAIAVMDDDETLTTIAAGTWETSPGELEPEASSESAGTSPAPLLIGLGVAALALLAARWATRRSAR